MARSAAIQYLDFIGQDHPTTPPCRGVGFHGITLGIGRRKSTAQETCYFSVNKRGSATKFYIDEGASLSHAWEQAVKYWGDVFDIRPKDIAKKLEQVPNPDRFKSLRKQLNGNEGCDYQASVLHHVYAEQRSQLQKHKAKKSTKGTLNQDDLLTMYANLERQLSEYRK